MKNKKGFTLIELLSVIVLIGIVLSLAVLGVSSIRKTVLEKQYINVKTEIEIAAEKYYNDTESMQMYVQTLLDEGYLKADNESKEIVDPRDSQNILNCYIVNIKNEKGKLDDTGNYEKDCKQELKNTYAIKIIKENNEEIEDKWYNEPFIVKANAYDETINNYIWTTEQNPNAIGTENTYDLNILVNERGGILNDLFYISGINKEGKVIRSAGQRIKIDTIKPKIDNINVSNSTDWVKEKTISVELSDVGSGIYSYSFDTEKECQNEESWIELDIPKNKTTISKIVNQMGTYYFCAKDGAGNEITSDEIKVDKVDGVPPKCSYDGESTNWINGSRTILFGCEDNESGCKYIENADNRTECNDKICLKTYEFKNSAKTENIANTIGTFTIYDQVGNKTVCPITDENNENKKTDLDVYLDNDKPIIDSVVVKSKEVYNSREITVTIIVSDNHSGMNSVCVTTSGKDSDCNWLDINTCTKSNGKYTCNIDYTLPSSEGSGTRYSIFGHAKDNVGNTSNKNVVYTMYAYCKKTSFSDYGSWSSCSKLCGSGTKTRKVYYNDYYFSSHSCPTESESKSCNTMSCCSSTYKSGSPTYGSCSASCGTGKRSVNYKTYSNYDDSYCGLSTSYESCTNNSGCPKCPTGYTETSSTTCQCRKFASNPTTTCKKCVDITSKTTCEKYSNCLWHGSAKTGNNGCRAKPNASGSSINAYCNTSCPSGTVKINSSCYYCKRKS